MVVETLNFLHLDFSIVAKILASSELNTHTEVEVFIAVINWLKHDNENRSNYAKQLLSKVRFTLLSEPALKYISNCDSIFRKKEDFVKLIKTVSLNKESLLQKNSSGIYTNRFCSQVQFEIIVCGGYNYKSNTELASVKQIDGSNLNKVKTLSSMNEERSSFEAVSLKGEIYVFGGCNSGNKFVKSVEKYTPSTNEWTVLTVMLDERRNFCACSFIDKVFIFGGFYTSNNEDLFLTTNSCLEFNTKHNNFKEACGMIEERSNAACTVFQGNIVVSGGENINNDYLKTVESYDVFAHKWTPMPNTINRHDAHSLVVVKDKLFVIGHEIDCCEVFDKVCMKFVSLKHPPSIDYNKSVPIGNKIFAFQDFSSSVISYNVDKDEWSEESCELTNCIQLFSCAKLPWC